MAKTEVKKDKAKDSFEAALGALNGMYGEGTVLSGNQVIKTEKVSSGSLGLDIALGGGYGKGRIIEIYGPESAGKSTLSVYPAIELQRLEPDKEVVIIDAEHAVDREYYSMLGLDMDRVHICQPDNGEQGLEVAEKLISSGKVGICIIDSVAALTPKAEIEGEMGDSQMGLQSRLMSKALRKLTGPVKRTGTILIFINQLREKIGVMFGNPETTTGGNALKFYASIRIDVRKAPMKELNGNNEPVGTEVTCKVVKNKLAPPFKKAKFDNVFGIGIDKASEILTLGEELGFIKKAGSWFSYGGTRLGQGAPAVKALLRDNLELMEELEAKIREIHNL